ncbi:hypothetical protein [Burkholderia pyrrocinia]|uniref:hypothetical protein n=1 Tax=Burkholderia pyrrocinia TaxID=60550 RepID=UPI0030D1B1F2
MKTAVLALSVSNVSGACAETPAPESVRLANGHAIAWRDAPAGIDVWWEYLAHGGATHRVYRFVNGTFAEVEVPR